MARTIRTAGPDDAAACARIYAPYVEHTAISFETDVPTSAQMAARIAAAVEWLVLDEGDGVVGYAYAGRHRERAAYRFACDVSVYLQTGLRRTGAGRALYEELFSRLSERGYRIALAGITLPNPASVGLHNLLGFQPVGVYRGIGWKHERWHDVQWAQRALGTGGDPPAEPH